MTQDTEHKIRVECYAGYRGEETPRRLSFAGESIEIIEIIDRWLSPDHRYFKVRGEDQIVYILRLDVAIHRWEITQEKGHTANPQ